LFFNLCTLFCVSLLTNYRYIRYGISAVALAAARRHTRTPRGGRTLPAAVRIAGILAEGGGRCRSALFCCRIVGCALCRTLLLAARCRGGVGASVYESSGGGERRRRRNRA
jgi:hypothetical protein